MRAAICRSLLPLVAALTIGAFLTACGGAVDSRPALHPSKPVVTPGDPVTPDAMKGVSAGGDPFALGAPLAEDPPPSTAAAPDLAAWAAARSVAGVSASPAACEAFAQRRAIVKGGACVERSAALVALEAALAEAQPATRDARLVALESCAGLPAGLVRALRADLAPVECGDAIADPTLGQHATGVSNDVLSVLVAQSLAAHLARTVGKPPALGLPHDKARVLAYVTGPLKTWIEAQARAIEAISRSGAKLTGYAKGIVAVEAGLADMRFVERARDVPVPSEFEKDAELKTAYLASLDQTLEPRKDRGRDAALLGLRELAVVGVLHDARVDKARALLAQLYAGRRIVALDALLLPELAPATTLTLEERLAATLPTFYANALLDETTVTQPTIVRALLQRGLPASLRLADGKGALGPEARAVYARGRLDLGRTYWRAVDFDRAARIESARRKEGEDATFLLALGVALRSGPKDAVEMMHVPSPAAIAIRNVAALDTITGKYAGAAAFDAALLLVTAPPNGAGAAYFDDVAKRFHGAAARLTGPEKGMAEERARNTEATARAAGPVK